MKNITAALLAIVHGVFAWMFGTVAFQDNSIRNAARNAAITMDDLNNKLLDLSHEANSLQAMADAESRLLTETERDRITEIHNLFTETEVEIQRRTDIEAMHAKMRAPRDAAQVVSVSGVPAATPAQAAAIQDAGTRRPVATGNAQVASREDTGKWGFRSMAEYLGAVRNASAQGAAPDPRLIRNAPTTYGNESVGADGGFAVPPDFRAGIIKILEAEDSLLARTDQMPTSSNAITLPLDLGSNWSTSGIQSYWESEGGQKTQSKPALSQLTVRTNKIITLVPLTDELLQDAAAMTNYVNSKAPEMIAFKLNAAIIGGSGTGQPLGIINSAGTVTVAAESGQAADTVIFENLQKMFYRTRPESRKGGVWLMNPDVEERLPFLSFPTSGGTVAVPLYIPPGGASQAPYGTLFGRPIIPTEACSALGDAGDVIFGDLRKYLSVVKSGGIQTAVSIHLWFDYDVTAFRFVLRVGGQPWMNTTVAGYQAGTNARGMFTMLATRS